MTESVTWSELAHVLARHAHDEQWSDADRRMVERAMVEDVRRYRRIRLRARNGEYDWPAPVDDS